jgi:soluble lytic murein transglycosylase
MLDQARVLRRADQDADALALWLAQGPAAQASVPTSRLADYWGERHILARRLLRNGDDQGAYALVSAHGQAAAEQVTDAEFLAGYIALRRLKQPTVAIRHFRALASASHAMITQGRAWYWLGRAEAAAGRDPKPFYARAATLPTTFYGQLAAVALGEDADALARRINALKDPGFTPLQVSYLAGRELAHAAGLLAGWSEPRRAYAFLLRLDELSPDPSDRALAARYALGLGMPEMAVFIARRMGRDGVALPEAGWPMPVEPPATHSRVDPAVALGLMRQESSFEVGVVSSAGARGLMQLMPATAQIVARQLGEGTSPAVLTSDPQHNMRLGTAYLAGLLDRFGGSLPLAAAGYNAGPNRVDTWLADNGDPRPGAIGVPIDMIDWIELIPFNETRNYVQRVLENVVVYRAKRGETMPTLVAEWAK